jgi:lipopolysaccharide export system permease protein
LLVNKYIIKTITSYTFFVLIVLLGIYTFFAFLGEVSNLGQHHYDIKQIVFFIVLTMPKNLYELSPIIILLGVMLGLGALAKNSEIIVLRSAGLSFYYFVRQTLKIGLFFVIIAMIMGELLAPKLATLANHNRAKALGQSVGKANQHWFKHNNTFINVENSIGSQLKGVSFIEVDDFSALKQITHSNNGYYKANDFVLKNVEHYQFSGLKLNHQKQATKKIKIKANSDVLNIDLVAKNLSLFNLYEHINFLNNNHINASFYEVEFYKRATMPLILFIMLLVAIPFVFGSLRDNSLSKKIFLAIIISIVFHLINQMSLQSALFYEYSPLAGATIPLLPMVILILYLFKKAAQQ